MKQTSLINNDNCCFEFFSITHWIITSIIFPEIRDIYQFEATILKIKQGIK